MDQVHTKAVLLPRGMMIKIRPNESAMEMLVQVLRKSYITYRFFPIVRLLLEKKDRYQIVIVSETEPFFYWEDQQQPFLTLDRAYEAITQHLWSAYFEEEKVPIEPPKGVFTSINRCGITQRLIGPPNYHLYNELLKTHYQRYLKEHYSWEDFICQIKNEHSPQCVQEWLEQVSFVPRYHFKPNVEICFDQRTAAKNYLVNYLQLNEKLTPITRLALTVDQVDNLWDGQLKEAIERELQQELQVPVRLGSYCRAFLHHSGFHIYRKGKRNEVITYICSVKRHVRDEFTFFTEEINRIIRCIEQHPYKTLEELIPCFLKQMGATEEMPGENSPEIMGLKHDLILLIKQGYITQYEDGTLYISPQQTLASKQNRKKGEDVTPPSAQT